MAYQHLPGLPAYLIFMAVRHTDYINDDEKVGRRFINDCVFEGGEDLGEVKG